mgnify:CR=1 FL=1
MKRIMEEKRNSRDFHRLLKDSFDNSLIALKERRKELLSRFKIEEKCGRCGWRGKREKTMPVGEQGTLYFYLCCPGCGATIREGLVPKNLWKM